MEAKRKCQSPDSPDAADMDVTPSCTCLFRPAAEVTGSSDLTLEQLQTLQMRIFNAVKSGSSEDLSNALAGLSDDVIKHGLCVRFWNLNDFQIPQQIASSWSDTQGHLCEEFIDSSLHYMSCAQGNDHAPALLCAALRGHLDVMKLLVAKGVDINAVDSRGQTALHIASKCGHLDIVEFLIEMGAKTNIADTAERTCLARACKPGNEEILRLLLEKGVDPNYRSPSQETALHAAAVWNAPAAAKILLKHGAILCKDSRGHNPLMFGIIIGSTEFVEVLLQSSLLTLNERVDALELSGAVAAEKDIDLAYEYLHAAMQHRYEDPSVPLLKSHHQPVQNLGDFVESQSLGELEVRRLNHRALQLESFLIYERLLGAESIPTKQRYYKVFHYLTDQHLYRDAMMVWRQARRAYQKDHVPYFADSRVLDMFENMLRQNISPLFSQVENVLILFMETIEQAIAFIPAENNPEFYVQKYISYCLNCITLALEVAESQHQIERLHEMVERFITVCRSVCQDNSVLHFALLMLDSPSSLVTMTEVTRASLLSFLLNCGADIDATDSGGNTALHKAVAHGVTMCWSTDTVCDITRCLLEHGAHVDVQNKDGQTPLDCCATNEVEAILREYQPLSLLCLATSTVVILEIPYQDLVPEMVQEYITFHYPGQVCPRQS